MAGIKLTSSKVNIHKNLKSVVSAIIANGAVEVTKSYMKRKEERLKEIAKDWQALIRGREGLGIQSTKERDDPKSHSKTEGPYPERRTGKLQKSIKKPKLTIEEYGGRFGRKFTANSSGNITRLTSYRFKLSGLFGRRGSNRHGEYWRKRDNKFVGGKRLADVGMYLNDLDPEKSNVAGWRDKSQRILFENMREEMLRG